MLTRLILSCLILSSCQRGLIPCPVVETIEFAERARRPKQAVLADARENEEEKVTRRPKSDRVIQNVTLEEWDCPRTDSNKKYIPRSVKQNIKRNSRRINRADSLYTIAPVSDR